MNVVIFVLVDLLVVADITCAMGIDFTHLEIGTSGTIRCDHVRNDGIVRLVQWYKSRNIDEFVNGDPSLVSWADGVTESQANYHMEDTTFSLVIEKATLENEGLYKCSVESGDLYTESSYFTRTEMYALPQKNPEVTLDNDLNRVKCTVEHVRPMIYPVCDWSPDRNETYAVSNENGTYTTSVSCTLPQNKCTSRVYCSFSYLHYQRVVSLDLPDSTTDSPMEIKTTTMSPIGTSVTFAGDGRKTMDHTAIIVLMTILITLLIGSNAITLIISIKLRRKYHRDVQKSNWSKESEVKTMAEVTTRCGLIDSFNFKKNKANRDVKM